MTAWVTRSSYSFSIKILQRCYSSLAFCFKLYRRGLLTIAFANRVNRYSMPVTRSRNGLYDMNLDQTNTTRFLFGDDEPNALPRGRTPDDNFPTLVRREDQMVSARGIPTFCDARKPPSLCVLARSGHGKREWRGGDWTRSCLRRREVKGGWRGLAAVKLSTVNCQHLGRCNLLARSVFLPGALRCSAMLCTTVSRSALSIWPLDSLDSLDSLDCLPRYTFASSLESLCLFIDKAPFLLRDLPTESRVGHHFYQLMCPIVLLRGHSCVLL